MRSVQTVCLEAAALILVIKLQTDEEVLRKVMMMKCYIIMLTSKFSFQIKTELEFK